MKRKSNTRPRRPTKLERDYLLDQADARAVVSWLELRREFIRRTAEQHISAINLLLADAKGQEQANTEALAKLRCAMREALRLKRRSRRGK